MTNKNYEAIEIYNLKEKIFNLKRGNTILKRRKRTTQRTLKDCLESVKKDYGDYLTYTQSAIYQEINQALGELK